MEPDIQVGDFAGAVDGQDREKEDNQEPVEDKFGFFSYGTIINHAFFMLKHATQCPGVISFKRGRSCPHFFSLLGQQEKNLHWFSWALLATICMFLFEFEIEPIKS